MGMGYGAASAYVLDVESLTGKVRTAYNVLLATLKEVGADLDGIATELANAGNLEALVEDQTFTKEEAKAVESSFYSFKKIFKKETGLSVDIGYHDKDAEGDHYDDVDGAYWWVEGLYKETPAYKKARKMGIKIEHSTFVQFG